MSKTHPQVTGLDLRDMARAYSTQLPGSGAVLLLSYPNVDARNHKSLDALTAALSGHGMPRVAALLHDETPFVVLDDAAAALRVFHEIERDSLAIGVSLFFKGESGAEAERAIQASVPHVSDSIATQHAQVHAH